MFDYTRAAVDKTISDVKRISLTVTVATQLIYILYLVYAIIMNTGIIWVNIPLLVLSVAYFVFYLVYLNRRGNVKRTVKHTYKGVKLLLNSITLATTIYGIYLAAERASAISIILAALTTIGWIFGVLCELVTYFFESHKDLIFLAVKEDFDAIKDTVTRPVNAVTDFIKRATGHAAELPEAEEKIPRRKRILDKLVAKRKVKKEALRAMEKEKNGESSAFEKEKARK